MGGGAEMEMGRHRRTAASGKHAAESLENHVFVATRRPTAAIGRPPLGSLSLSLASNLEVLLMANRWRLSSR